MQFRNVPLQDALDYVVLNSQAEDSDVQHALFAILPARAHTVNNNDNNAYLPHVKAVAATYGSIDAFRDALKAHVANDPKLSREYWRCMGDRLSWVQQHEIILEALAETPEEDNAALESMTALQITNTAVLLDRINVMYLDL